MNQNNISTAELFQRVRELLMLPELEPQTRNKMMHDTLILCCHEGVKDTRQAFGNLFSQVDYLCKARVSRWQTRLPSRPCADTATRRNRFRAKT